MKTLVSSPAPHLELLEPRLLLSAWFVDVSAPAGLDDAINFQYGHGAAWGDVNNNGLPDLFWGAWNTGGPNLLLLNNGDGTFSDSPQASINNPRARTSGSVFADLNNNGWLDLVVMNNWSSGNPVTNQLLMNTGNGNFIDVTAGSGIDIPGHPGRNVWVLDYDNDGLLDLIIQSCRFQGGLNAKETLLMRNNGDMTFTNVTAAAGLPTGNMTMVGLGGAVGDINGDGWPDFLHVGITDASGASNPNKNPPNIQLFINNRDGTFHESTTFNFNATFPAPLSSDDWVCGAAIGDLNGNGLMDVVIGQHHKLSSLSTRPMSVRAYMNLGNNASGDPLWQDITVESGLHALHMRQPNVDIQDFNNDGRMDIWNGVTIEHVASGEQMPYIQFNQGNNANGVPQFAPMPGLMPPSTPWVYLDKGLVNPRYYAASPTADFNRDGKMNIFGADWSESTSGPSKNNSGLFHNLIAGDDFIAIKIDQGEGTPNRYGVGARVTIYEPGQAGNPAARLGSYLLDIGNGYAGGREAIAHFGVPGRDFVDIVVQMPYGGATYTSTAVPTRQYVVMPYVAAVDPPAVDSVVINHGSTMRSELVAFEVAFTQDITLPATAVQLWDHASGTQVNIAAAIITATSSSSYMLDMSAISLANGWYTLRLVGDEISNANGTLEGDFDLLTHRLAGDANGDAKVNVDDLGILATNYRASGDWWTLNADFTLDGVVNVDDLGILATNYRIELAPPAPLPSGPMMVTAAAADDDDVLEVQYLQQPTLTGEPLLAEMQLASPALLEGTAGDEPADIATVIAEDAEEEPVDVLAMLQPIA